MTKQIAALADMLPKEKQRLDEAGQALSQGETVSREDAG